MKNLGSSSSAVTGPSGSLCGYTTSTSSASIAGFYWWSWDSGTPSYPSGTNLGVAFTGYSDPASALSGSNLALPGLKYIALGGGNSAGDWTSSVLTSITNSINNNNFNAYHGIVFDVEQGDSGLSGQFETAFQAAHNHGLSVLVTISHSAPYGINDAASLMSDFLSSTNIDYISPQLYTTGTETTNDYSNTTSWNQYASSRAQVVPSIVTANLYSDAYNHFQSYGVTLHGYIQWAQ